MNICTERGLNVLCVPETTQAPKPKRASGKKSGNGRTAATTSFTGSLATAMVSMGFANDEGCDHNFLAQLQGEEGLLEELAAGIGQDSLVGILAENSAVVAVDGPLDINPPRLANPAVAW